MNIYKTYEPERTANGFRIIFVHSSLKQQDDEARKRQKLDKAIARLEELSPKLNAYHLKTKKDIKAAVKGICKGVKGFIHVKILTKRKQIKVKLSPGRTCLSKSIFRNKWEFTYSIQWELNEKALADASKTDGIFPLITNTALEAREVLRKYKSQPFLEKRMY